MAFWMFTKELIRVWGRARDERIARIVAKMACISWKKNLWGSDGRTLQHVAKRDRALM